ncbi:uncharacterized protein LOC127806750 isoform X2 [Diospyros lotus]|uniref:uncharacterized protein LOC127806750 isoform X2 n=1 Tax=Diospyros lotus TaxID=55363 RepID=UPI00224E0DB8|nr:uncharacterized protein LOC127806750 isoform X2 [Diospyros lotus]
MPNPSLLFLLFLSSASLISFSHGSSLDPQHSPLPEFINERGFSGLPKLNSARFLGKASDDSATLVLAANRTHRRDPLNGLNYYNGGWNITNQHYLSSMAFSAAPMFIIAGVWFLMFGMCLCCICLRRCFCCCPQKKALGYSQTAFALSLTLLILFSATTITGSVSLYGGQGKFLTSVTNLTDYLLKRTDTVIENLGNVINYLFDAKNIAVGEVALPQELQANIDDDQKEVNLLIDNFRNVTQNTANNIHNFLVPLRVAIAYAATVALILAVLGFLLSILGLQCCVDFLMIFGWIAVVGAFIMSGMFLLVHNAVSDTCVAMEEWLQNPTANSAIEDIIPRANENFTRDILTGTKAVTFALVNATNFAIATAYNSNLPPEAGPLYFNQSGPPVPVLCNPLDLNLTDQQCAGAEVGLENAPQVWKNYICQASPSGICTTPGRLTPSTYRQVCVRTKYTKNRS